METIRNFIINAAYRKQSSCAINFFFLFLLISMEMTTFVAIFLLFTH